MSKKRVIEQPEVDSAQLSAFAIKRLRSLPTQSHAVGDQSDSQKGHGDVLKRQGTPHGGKTLSSSPSQPDAQKTPRRKKKNKRDIAVQFLPRSSPPAGTSDDSSVMLSSEGLASGGDDSDDHGLSSRMHADRITRLRLVSSFKPNTQNVLKNVRGSIVIRLKVGETLASLGQYDFRVRKGVVTLMGATLRQSPTLYRIYAPSTHSIPVVKCIGTSQVVSQEAEIEYGHYDDGLRSLRKISPLFGRIWSEERLQPHSAASLTAFNNRSFHLLCDTQRVPPTRPLHTLEIPPQWNTSLQTIFGHLDRPQPKVLVCGPKSSGKSTFVRHCCNHILTKAPDKQAPNEGSRLLQNNSVALIDLDPGQPEFSAPGQLSLIHLRCPMFGPHYTHPTLPLPGDNRIIRAHNIAAFSPKDNPCHYTACAIDLVAHYRELLLKYPSCPLVINCSGWIFGPGLEVTMDLIQKLIVSDIVYMSQEGLVEVVQGLREAAQGIPFHMLPSQPSQYVSRTSAELRSMQSLSYFHYDSFTDDKGSWSSTPITSMKPWRVRYSGPSRGIHSIMIYGEQQPPELLSTIIDGSLMAMVVLENDANIPDFAEPSPASPKQTSLVLYNGGISEDCENPKVGTDHDSTDSSLDDEVLNRASNSQYIIMRTSVEKLPYLMSCHGITMPLDPTKSYSIGLALIRGIDVAKEEIQIITPIPESTILDLQASGAKIILVGGKLDTPAWAYQELYSAAVHADMQRAESGDPIPLRESIEGWKGKAPWVRVLRGMEGKGVGEEVWRVRRNLKPRGEGMKAKAGE